MAEWACEVSVRGPSPGDDGRGRVVGEEGLGEPWGVEDIDCGVEGLLCCLGWGDRDGISAQGLERSLKV